MKLRIFNEAATVILVSVVFIVILKSTLDWLYGVLGLLIFIIALMVAITLYKKLRIKKQ
jgi:putative membrane protein